MSKATSELSKRLIDEGLIVMAGFVIYRQSFMPATATPAQVDECRQAFFAGAQHLLGSISDAMEDGAEPTENDLRRMEKIDAELSRFADELSKRLQTEGSG